MGSLKDSLYEKYVSERLGAQIIENDNGFIVYKIIGEEAFISEMFIEEKLRYQGRGSFLISELSQTVKELGCKIITANVFLFDKNASKTLVAAIKCGFKVVMANNGCISISKDIGG